MLSSLVAPRAFLLAPGNAPPVEWVVTPGLTEFPDALADMEARSEAIARGERGRTGLAHRASCSLHRRDKRQGKRPHRRALSSPSRRPRRPVHLSRTRATGGLCHARPQAPPARRAGVCGHARKLADRDAEGVRRRWRDAPGPGRRLGRASRQTAFGPGRNGRGQDRRDRRPHPALGDASRRGAERRSRSRAISPASRLAGFGSRTTASPASSTSAARRRWRERTPLCARRSRRCSARPSIRPGPLAFEPALARRGLPA